MLDAITIRHGLVRYFSLEDLRNLAFDLGLDYETLHGGENKTALARELVAACVRQGRLETLVVLCEQLQPEVAWRAAAGTLPGPAGAAALPPFLALPHYTYKVDLVRDRVVQVYDEHILQKRGAIPAAVLLSELRGLFNRQTFNEPFELCVDQNWHDRLCAVVEVEYLLAGCWQLVKDGLAGRREAHWLQKFEAVQTLVRRYGQALVPFFDLAVPLTVAEVNRRFLEGNLEEIRAELDGGRLVREAGLDPDVVAEAEAIRLEVVAAVARWPAVA